MRQDLIATLSGVLETVVLTAISATVSAIGLLLESQAITALIQGELVLGAWFLFMGALALYGGIYLVGYRKVLTRLRTTTSLA